VSRIVTARLASLEGKYYGTQVLLRVGDQAAVIDVWCMGDGIPSGRQLSDWGMTLDEARGEEGMCCDNHYETRDCYAIAKQITRALHGLTLDGGDGTP
jgi:hypothetical protein